MPSATLLACATLLSSGAWAQTAQPLVRAQDPLPDGGLIETIDNIWVLNNGTWLTRGERDAASPAPFFGLRSGMALPAYGPEGEWAFDEQGNRLQVQNGVLLYNGQPFLPSDFLQLLGLGDHFLQSLLSFDFDSQGRVALLLRVLPPGSPAGTIPQPTVALLDVDELGGITKATVVSPPAAPGTDVLQTPSDSGPHAFEANGSGTVLWGAEHATLGPVIAIDAGALHTQRGFVFLDPQDPAVNARTLQELEPYALDINDAGDIVYTCTLDGAESSDYLIVRNQEKFVQEGDLLPALAGAVIGGNNNAPVIVANSGHVFWATSLTGTDPAHDRAFMRDQTPILRRGQALADGRVVTQISLRRNAFHVSRDGRFFVGRVGLDGQAGVVLIDFGLAEELPSNTPHAATMTLLAGAPLVGGSLIFELEGGQFPGVSSALLISTQAAAGVGGVPTPFGDLLIGPLTGFVLGTPWFGGSAYVGANLPADPALIGMEFFVQGAFLDIGGMFPGPDVRLSNGYRLVFGAP